MNDTPARPVAPQADKPSETAAHGLEATGTVVRPGGGPASGEAVLETIGDYSVVKKIGEGGMGAVYLAEDTKLGRKVAIKTMRPELAANQLDRDRFVREARAAAAVESDYIVPIWGVGDAADGTPFIAMPFLQGEMLDARLKREPVAPLGLVLKVTREVAEGLAAAHAKGLIHRDIKPANVWLEGDPASKHANEQIRRCKILDFGLARSVDKEDAQLTASGAILGTPAFMAPEQARGEKVDHRADLFSLGVTLYRMATGQVPFNGPNAMAVLIALTTETPTPVRELVPNLPPALAELIERLMSKDPAGRPQSAAEVAATVRQIVKELQAKKAASDAPAPTAPTPASSQHVPVYVLPAPAPSPWEGVTEAEPEAPILKRPGRENRGIAPWLIAGGVVGLFVLLAAAAVLVIRLQTGHGTLVVEIHDPAVEARVKDGKLVLTDAGGKDRYALSLAERNKAIDPGKYTIRVEGADGLSLDTREFTLKKNGQVTVRVTLDPKESAAKKPAPKPERVRTDAGDRRAAEYALAIGGAVRVDHQDGEIKAADDLPRGGFELTGIDLAYNREVTNASLAAFENCTSLTSLSLFGSGVADAGLAHFKNCKELKEVDLHNMSVTDVGLSSFQNCSSLTVLKLASTEVRKAGMGHFKECKRLKWLDLYDTRVGDEELRQMRSLLDLEYLDVRKTNVTPTGVAGLAKLLPRCKIEWDGGVIEPKAAAQGADRKAAEWVLAGGGRVQVNGENNDIKKPGELPKGDVQLTAIYLTAPVKESDLSACQGCANLTILYLVGTQIGNPGLAQFKDSKGLKELYLSGTKVDDASVPTIKQFTKLTDLSVGQTKITEKGVKELAEALPGCRIQHNGGTVEPKK